MSTEPPATRLERVLTTTRDDVGREITGQLSGYWVRPSDEIPAVQPGYRPTGAVLPKAGTSVGRGFLCLDLVSVDYDWLVLSESGMYTYSHSEGLLRGERGWRFVTWRGGQRLVFNATFSERDLLDPLRVQVEYGDAAAGHARRDRRAVQLRLSPIRRR